MDAGDDHCAYVLRKGRSKKNTACTTFYLYAKFCYQPYKSSKDIGSQTEGEQTTIEVESNVQKAGGLRKMMPSIRWRKGSTSRATKVSIEDYTICANFS